MVARRGQKVETKIAQGGGGEGRCSGWMWSVVCRARLVGRLEESMDDGDCENTRPVGITMLGLGVVSVSVSLVRVFFCTTSSVWCSKFL